MPEGQELEELVAKRLRERREIINEAVEALRPELQGMRREIAGANHVKRTLGRQLTELKKLIEAHIKLAMHPGQAEDWTELMNAHQVGKELLRDFHVETLTEEQRALMPLVLQDFSGRLHKKAEREKWHQTWWGRGGVVAGSVVAGVDLLRALHVLH